MVQRRQRERSLFEVLLPDGHKLWPDWLRKIDTLLEDEAVIEVVAQALEKRWPQSRRRGRLGTPAEVVIRMLINLPFHDLRRECGSRWYAQTGGDQWRVSKWLGHATIEMTKRYLALKDPSRQGGRTWRRSSDTAKSASSGVERAWTTGAAQIGANGTKTMETSKCLVGKGYGLVARDRIELSTLRFSGLIQPLSAVDACYRVTP